VIYCFSRRFRPRSCHVSHTHLFLVSCLLTFLLFFFLFSTFNRRTSRRLRRFCLSATLSMMSSPRRISTARWFLASRTSRRLMEMLSLRRLKTPFSILRSPSSRETSCYCGLVARCFHFLFVCSLLLSVSLSLSLTRYPHISRLRTSSFFECTPSPWRKRPF